MSFCKTEMQDFFRYFVCPLAQKCIQTRKDREGAMREPPTYVCDGRKVTFSGLVEHWKQELEDAYTGLTKGAWCAAPHVDIGCYQPTELPYFLSYDNAPAHSLWEDSKKNNNHLKRESMPLSLLQIIRICPKGHDFHQLVEHAIGAIKGHVSRNLVGAMDHQEPIESDLVWDLVQEAKGLFTDASWNANLVRLNHALRVIAAERSETVRFAYPKNVEREFAGQAGNYAPMFLS